MGCLLPCTCRPQTSNHGLHFGGEALTLWRVIEFLKVSRASLTLQTALRVAEHGPHPNSAAIIAHWTEKVKL